MNNSVDRMKELMGYKSQSSVAPKSNIEYMTEGADGKVYGVIRENNKYYIKVANKGKNLVSENFDYIGGFANKKANEYTSCSVALKNIELKLMEINNSRGGKMIVEQVTNPSRNADLKIRLTESMAKEIARSKQIVENSTRIEKGQPIVENEKCTPKVGSGAHVGTPKNDPEYTEVTPDNGKENTPETPGKKNLSKPFGAKDDGTAGVRKQKTDLVKFDGKHISESKEQLLDRIINEEFENMLNEPEEDDKEIFDGFGEEGQEGGQIEKARELNDELGEILDDMEFPEDESLYPEEEGEDLFPEEEGEFPEEEEYEITSDDDFKEDEDPAIKRESRRIRGRFMNEDTLHDFGRHPSYRKPAFRTPSNSHQEFPWANKWDDESVENETPYGTKIGDSAPFNTKVDYELNRAVDESINRFFKKKI